MKNLLLIALTSLSITTYADTTKECGIVQNNFFEYFSKSAWNDAGHDAGDISDANYKKSNKYLATVAKKLNANKLSKCVQDPKMFIRQATSCGLDFAECQHQVNNSQYMAMQCTWQSYQTCVMTRRILNNYTVQQDK